jgi:hypothetical protein
MNRSNSTNASSSGTCCGGCLQKADAAAWNGSFFDFSSELFRGQNAERLTSLPDDWGGRAAAEWVSKLAAGERFAGTSRGLIETARVLDRLYGRSGGEFR